MRRRVGSGLAAVVLVLILGLGVEVWLAARRHYLGADDALHLDRSFGRPGSSPFRFVVLGDSTSVGIGASDASQAYPSVLAQRLAELTDRQVELTVLGASGARVSELADTQAPEAVKLEADLIFIGIGANDVTHLTPLGEIRAGMRRALGQLARSDARVVVAGAPDMRASAWPEPLRSLAYLRGKQVAAAIEQVAREQGFAVVELAEATGRYFAERPEAHFSEDGFHPGDLGYRRWADAIFPLLAKELQQAPG